MRRDDFKFVVGAAFFLLLFLILLVVFSGWGALLYVVGGVSLVVGLGFVVWSITHYGSKLLDVIYDRWIKK